MRRMLTEGGRIVNPVAGRYIGMQRLFAPKNMTAEKVEDGVWRCLEPGLASNLIFRRAVRHKKDPLDFY